MKTSGMLLDLKNDSYRILGKYIKLQSTTSRHYSLPLINMLLEVERAVYVVLHCKEGKLRNYKGNLLVHQKRN